MNIRITFRGMDHSVAIENYATKAADTLTKYLEKEPEPVFMDVILEAHKQHAHHKVECRLNSKNFHFIIDREGSDLYQEIDHVMKIAKEEIKKIKDKMLDKRNHPDIKKDTF